MPEDWDGVIILVMLIFGLPILFTGLGGEFSGYDFTGDSTTNSEPPNAEQNKNLVLIPPSDGTYSLFPPFSSDSSTDELNKSFLKAGDNSDVVFMNGSETYIISEPIHINKNVDVDGGGVSIIASEDYSGNGFMISNTSNVSFKNLTLIGFNRAFVLEDPSSSLSMNNVRVFDSGAGVYAEKSINGWFIRNSKFVNNTYGVFAMETESRWKVVDSDFRENKYGVYAIRTSEGWDIDRSNIENNTYGIFAASTQGSWRVSYSNIHKNNEYELYLTGTESSPTVRNVYLGDETDRRTITSNVRVILDSCNVPYCGR